MSQVHQVPMCRQRIDPGEWDAHGGAALGDRAEWSDRACGMAALRMILLAYRRPAPPLTELVALGVREGALTGRGWLHADIARLANLGIGILVTVGHGLMDTLANAARTSPSQPAIHAVGDLDELLPMLRRLLRPGDVVFIKASRSVGLENFAATLETDGPTRPAG